MFKDYYAILGLGFKFPPDVDVAEIRKAYHEQTLKWHPDHNKGRDTTKIMADINEAYSTLSNPSSKAKYDKEYLRYWWHKKPQGPKPHKGVARTILSIIHGLLFAVWSVLKWIVRGLAFVVRYVWGVVCNLCEGIARLPIWIFGLAIIIAVEESWPVIPGIKAIHGAKILGVATTGQFTKGWKEGRKHTLTHKIADWWNGMSEDKYRELNGLPPVDWEEYVEAYKEQDLTSFQDWQMANDAYGDSIYIKCWEDQNIKAGYKAWKNGWLKEYVDQHPLRSGINKENDTFACCDTVVADTVVAE